MDNTNGNIPLAKTMRQKMTAFIQEMDSSAGLKLPKELDLAKHFAVSRATIRDVLEDLEKDGIIIRQHGRGTFVNPEALRIAVNLTPGEEFGQMIRDSGYKASMELTRYETVPAGKRTAEALRIPIGSPVAVIEKVFFANGHPAIVCIDRFPTALLTEPVDEAVLTRMSTFEILQSNARRIVTRDKIELESMSVSQMKQFSASSQRMECDTVMVFHGINFDQDNHPVMFDTEFYDTNYIRFSMIRQTNTFRMES